jgi:desulfoferrodoxin (superoxide reductase-like protein)
MNKYYDINKFPKDWGMLVFPISMGRIAHGQHQKHYVEWLELFLDKISSNQVGAHFLYSDALYMNFETDAYKTKNAFAQASVSHKQGLMRLIRLSQLFPFKAGSKCTYPTRTSLLDWQR